MVKEFHVAVVGGGPGGYVAAIRAAQLGLKVALIEQYPRLGGTCLNVGCIPSKALLYATELYASIGGVGSKVGIHCEKLRCDFGELMSYKEGVVKGLGEGIAGLMKKNKITSITGKGMLKDRYTVVVTQEGMADRSITADHIILATGSKPIALPSLPFDGEVVVSSTGALALKEVPKKMIVIGAGAIGLELGSVYARLGSAVTFVEFFDRVCPSLDKAISKGLLAALIKQGMTFYLSHKVLSGKVSKKGVCIAVETPDKKTVEMDADVVLVSIGRKPYSQGLGLEGVNITPGHYGFIPVNSSFQTAVSNIYAIGDLIDGPMLAHKAEEEGIAVAEIIAGRHVDVNYVAIPNVVYTAPEAAAVGLTEEEGKELGLGPDLLVGTFPFKANSRARATGHEGGLVKVIGHKRTGRLLGLHILGHGASEMIGEGVAAIENGMTVEALARMPHAHPTFSEAIKEAALACLDRVIHS